MNKSQKHYAIWNELYIKCINKLLHLYDVIEQENIPYSKIGIMGVL